jgi:Zn-dependent peptidase ImmA (M78 family)
MNLVTNEPEDFARVLRKRFAITDAVDLYDLAQKLGLRIKDVNAQGFEGALIRASNKPNGIVAINQSVRESGRKRFTIAHEFGHYVLPGHGIIGRTCKGKNIESKYKRVPTHEAAANAFASELLLPAAEIQPFIQKRLASIETAELLSSKYETSLTAALLKSSDLTGERCCVVLSKNRVIEWAWPNASFKHFIGRRERLNENSLAHKLSVNPETGHLSGFAPAEVWLDDDNLIAGAKIYEDSILISYYHSILTILTINQPVTDQAVDEEDALDELDPHEFTINRRWWPSKR